ncbi:Transcription termination factor mitochondrial/chloroplastic [Arabidopsis thaliana x Arabidopsis arenosa]|uniref:Transcription termination factor MTERF4, chloroplastic n=1 Tax=Arabidopsis thaliana x Arabidopsis arenosa TaxID=1240361 RepID=A0A8T1Z2Z9_9BRAS|nr:Transcription termination factor mitochondrial/chloroplastic [Arabidopsis thaliana x Arabidopsis arenosa]KAG7553152.1 Transcription termination factor mitochondrial/chloroplastic [Arabidopsis thaliana x Arabidopsis arenosa]
MKIRFCSGFTKPGFLLVHFDPPSFFAVRSRSLSDSTYGNLCNHKKIPGIGIGLTVQCAIANRRFSSRSVDSSPKRERSSRSSSGRDRVKDKGRDSQSLYSRPSLLEMNKEKAANRAKVYEFLRGIGIVPDELDGLELPVTADVMKERVEFLHKLGLTIEDINNYPLVLGCSVKKNMVPVLDYLGKLGVRKSTFTEFLRRYPQVLHASVVIDLAPVVKYLQGLDIKPSDVPRVLERYPEVLGFKLEGTMSTSVAYLVGIGVARREIGGVLTRYPEILGMRVARIIKPFVEYLENLGIPRLAVARLIEKRPHILGFELDETVKPNVQILQDFNVRETSLPSIIAQYPEIIGIDLKPKLETQRKLLCSAIHLNPEDLGSLIERMPQFVSLSESPMLKHIDFLTKCGFSIDQTREMVIGCPQVLALNLGIMKLSFEYFQKEMRRPLQDLVDFPAFFTYGLESTIKPRHKKIIKKGIKCSLAWMLNCSDEKFEQRMSYDTIDIEEVESDPSSFDMSTLMQPEREEESDSEYEEEENDEEEEFA